VTGPARATNDLAERLGAAVDYLEAALGDRFDLGRAARQAGFSRWHFMRLFQTAAGMPVAEYVRRRRLSRAAESLAAGQPVVDTALDWGYGSQAAFTRAFSREFGVSPAAYARRSRAGGAPPGLVLPFEPRLPFAAGPPPPPRTVVRPGFRAVGLGIRAPSRRYQSFTDIPAFWDDWRGQERWRAIAGAAEGCATYGLVRVRASGEVEYLIALETTADAPVPRGYQAVRVPGGRYACFAAAGEPSRTVQALTLAVYAHWLPGAGVERRSGAWDLEVYHQDPELAPGLLRCEVWVPLAER
jgi:AraC family transcriptional regulator